MKKIFLFILIIISVNGLSQTGFPGQQSMANASTRLIVNGGLQGVRGIINGVFTDTTAANSDFIDFYNGAQIWTRSDRNFWLRDSVLNMWIRMAKYSEMSSAQTLQQVFNTEVGGSVLTKTDSILTNANTLKVITSTAGVNPLLVKATTGFGVQSQVTTGYGFYGLATGANGTGVLGNTTGTSGTNTGIYGLSEGTGATTNRGGVFEALNATNNYAIIVPSGSGRVGFGTTSPNASSILDLTSTSQGFLVPRMTEAQRDAIGTPATGLLIYQTDGTTGFYYYDGADWTGVGGSGSQGIDDVIATDPQLTTDREILTDGNEFAISDNSSGPSYYNFQIRTGARRFLFGDISTQYNGTFLSINDTATVLPRWRMTNVQEETGPKSLYYDPSNGKVSYDDATGGGVSAADLPLRISGSTVSADTLVAYNPSLTTNARLQKIIDSLSAEGWGPEEFNPDWIQVIDPCIGDLMFGFDWNTSGTGSSVSYGGSPPNANWWIGRATMSVGTTSTGYAAVGTSNGGASASAATSSDYRTSWSFNWMVEDIATAGEDYTIFCGSVSLSGGVGVGYIINGIYVRYNRADSSGNLILCTNTGGTITEKDSGVELVEDETFRVDISHSAGTVYYWITVGAGSKTLVGTITTNIPTANITQQLIINKTAGTTNRDLYLDEISFGVVKN